MKKKKGFDRKKRVHADKVWRQDKLKFDFQPGTHSFNVAAKDEDVHKIIYRGYEITLAILHTIENNAAKGFRPRIHTTNGAWTNGKFFKGETSSYYKSAVTEGKKMIDEKKAEIDKVLAKIRADKKRLQQIATKKSKKK